jgi:sporulation protein YlmC with PRC-barrel domain
MSHYGRLAGYEISETAEDIRGAALYGRDDEKLGKIEDVIFEHNSGDIQYIVVDTGGWLSTKRFVVPANRLQASLEHEGDFSSDLTKQQIESFPPYSEKDLDSGEKWGDYERKYRAKWETSPVMHRAETDRNITPTTQQMEGNQSSIRAAEGLPRRSYATGATRDDIRAANAPTERVVPAGTDSVVINNTATGISDRWDTFQARLRERRKQAVASCTTCSVGPASTRGSESADTLKKAI